MYSFYTRRNINIGLAVFLVLLVFFGWNTFINGKKTRQQTLAVNAALKSLHALEEVMDDMQDVETGHRGYLISGDSEFLAPYHNALLSLKEDTVFFKELYPLYPHRIPSFNSLLGLVKEKVRSTIASVALMNDKNRDSLYKEISTGYGKGIMDSIRQIVLVFENEDRIQLRTSNERRYEAASNTVKLFVVSASILLISVLLLFWKIKKELGHRDENEKQLSYLAGLIEKINDAVISTDINRKIESWNNAAEEMYGYTAAEAIGQPIHTLLKIQYPQLDEVSALKREFLVTKKSGDTFYIQASLSVLRNEKGEVTGYVGVHQDVTARKKTETLLGKFNEELNRMVQEKTAEIKHSNERFEMISRTTNDAIWENNLETGETWANETHQQLYGLTLNDPFPSESTWKDSIHPDDKEALLKGFDEVLASDKNIWITDYRILSGNEYRNIYDRTYIVRNEAGKPIRILGSMMDITERRRAQETIQSGEETRKLIMNASLDGIICIDRQGTIIVWTQQSERIFGWKADEAVGKNLKETIVPPRFREAHEQGLARYLATGKATVLNQLIEVVAINKNGEEFPIEISIVHITQGNSEFFCAYIRDITKRKLAETALKESEEKLRHVLSSSTDDFYVIDTEYRVTIINEKAEKSLQQLWGIPVKVGVNILDVLPVNEKERIQKNYERAFLGQTIEYETSGLIDDKIIWAQVRYTPVYNESGVITGLYIVSRDITERKIAEQELIRSNSRFEMIARTTNEAIWEWDFETGKLWGSETHQKLYGLQMSDPVPVENVWLERMHPEDRDRIKLRQEEALASGENVFISEYRFLTAEHGYRNIYDRSYIVRNEKGTPMRMMGSMVDITERKKAEQAVKESEERYRVLVENAPEALVVFDVESQKFAMVSDTASKLFKLSKEELLKKGPMDLSPKYQPDGKLSSLSAEEKVRETLEGGQASFDWIHLDKDGVEIPCQVWLVRLPSENRILLRGSIVNIAERRKAEEEIVKINARFHLVSKATSDIVWDWDIENNSFWWNDNYYKSLGYDKQADMSELEERIKRMHPADRKRVKNGVLKVINGEESTWQDNYRYCKKDGTYVDFLDRAFVLRDSEGKAFRMLGSMVDMTPVYDAQRKISNSEEKYRTLVEQAVDAIALYDEKGRILDVNTGSIQLLGYSKEELSQMTLSDILTNEEIITKPIQYDVLQGGESTVKQRSMKRKDGSVVQTEVRSQQLPDGRFLSVIRDLTERIKAQELVEREKELSDTIISSLPGVFYYFDHTGKYLRWNKRLEDVTGYSAEEIADMHPTGFFDADEKELIAERIKEVFEKGITDVEANLLTKSGEKIPYYFTGVLMIENGKPGLIGVGMDISDRKKAEHELEASFVAIRKLTAHLQNIREEERTHIAREIHDELGQQLTVLKMDISWLNKKLASQDNKIREKMKELLLMLDETVKTVRRIASELRPSLLDDLGLMAAMEWQLNEFEKRSGIKARFEGSESEISLSNPVKTALFRIFQESLTNVARHSEAKNVTVSLIHNAEECILSVVDNGKGFDEEKLKAKKTLGILGMHERTSMIGGTYSISGKPGIGTTVEVRVSLGNATTIN